MALAAIKTRPDSADFTSDPARWSAVLRRDKRADGRFYYSVATTGVYCRPSCAARLPRRENVRFHASPAVAERAGFRACKRCRPDGPSLAERRAAAVARACRAIERAEETPNLAALAREAGMSRFHFQRVFKEIAGVSPRGYAAGLRARRLRARLPNARNVTEAFYGAGFNSSGRFYESANALLGMTPRAFRAGGQGADIRFALGRCSLGSILVAATGKGVCAILLGDDPEKLLRDLQDRFPQALLTGGDRGFDRLVARVVGLVERPGRKHDLPLDLRGTAFQQRVWQALRRIPAGATSSYAELARRIGNPRSARAVAAACAANNLAVAIPCHRVVRRDGGLAGYRWGVERKRALILREAKTS